MPRIGGPHRIGQIATTSAVVLVAALIAVPAAAASTPFTDVHSSGPLSDIYIGNDLGCQVQSGGFSSTEFFPNVPGPGDCGTFVDLTSDNVSGGLFGPDFANHPGGTHTSFSQGETPFTATAGNQTLTGSGTAASPYMVTTTVTLSSPTGNVPVTLQVTEVDSYVVGDDFYRTDVTITNTGTVSDDNGGWLYHAADCQLRGTNTGFGAPEPSQASQNTVACTETSLNSPASALEEFVQITAGDSWAEASATTAPTIWSDLSDFALLDGCGSCQVGTTDNAEGIAWSFPGLDPGASSQTFSFETEIVDTVATGGFSFAGPTNTSVGGTVATITDPNTSATASAYSATINWGDDTSSAGTVTGGNGSFSVTGNHSYAAGATYPISVTITSVGNSQGSSTVTDSATITPPPTVTQLNPTAGPTAGGTSVTITGTNLAGATAVEFGTTSATITADTATSITATAPAHTAATVDVTVTTPGGTSATSATDQYTYAAPPTVTSLNPTAGPPAGGTAVTITGTNLTGATAVQFGTANATNLTGNTATTITATAPAATAGTVDVTVTTPGGTTATTTADRFTYNLPAPASPPALPPPVAPATSPPVVASGAPTIKTTAGAGVSGSVNPENLATTAFFQYGLDPTERGPGSPSTLYDESTPPQQVGSDSASHTVSAALTGLVPGALYHVRLVATNSAGTTFGPDQTFTTAQAPAPSPPVLGQSENAQPVSGAVFIRLPSGAFVRLTGAEQIRSGAVIDALHGSLQITTATGKQGKTQTGVFGGAVFKLTQAGSGASKGLVTLAIVEGAFTGAPSYSLCTTQKAGDPSATAASVKTLQLLHASAHGKFRTKGKYSAATVLGTKWTVADRCDGTLTHDITDSVSVTDFVHHKTVILHAGQSYLALAPGHSK